MTKIKFYLLVTILGILALNSCNNNANNPQDVVESFLKSINDKSKKYDKDLVTKEFYEFFEGKSFYLSQNWKLTVKSINDSTIAVESRGKTSNGFGQPVENVQGFYLTNKLGGWKIYNTLKLVVDDLDFKVVDNQWNFYSDMDKDYVLHELQKKLELKVLTAASQGYSSGSIGGKLMINNNSEFDIKNLNILIEHFDSQGKSVSTDHAFVSEIIRKQASREISWYTMNCGECEKQKFRISFIRESL